MADRDTDGSPVAASAATPDSRLGLLRELGEQAVLEAIFRRGPVTRPEIASATGLSKPTVGAAVGRLERAGMISVSVPSTASVASWIAYVARYNAGSVARSRNRRHEHPSRCCHVSGETSDDEQERRRKSVDAAPRSARRRGDTRSGAAPGHPRHRFCPGDSHLAPLAWVVYASMGLVRGWRTTCRLMGARASSRRRVVAVRGVLVLLDKEINLVALGEFRAGPAACRRWCSSASGRAWGWG